MEPEVDWGTLTTVEQFDAAQSKQQGRSWAGLRDLYCGKFKSLKGSYSDYYEDVVKAILGGGPLVITPKHARDGLRIIELGRESADQGKTLPMD